MPRPLFSNRNLEQNVFDVNASVSYTASSQQGAHDMFQDHLHVNLQPSNSKVTFTERLSSTGPSFCPPARQSPFTIKYPITMGIKAEAECVCAQCWASQYLQTCKKYVWCCQITFFSLVLNSPDLLHILLSFLHITSCDVTGLITGSHRLIRTRF